MKASSGSSDALSGHNAKVVERARAILSEGGDVLLACEPNAEGVLTAVALSYYARADAEHTRLHSKDGCQARLTERVLDVETDGALALRVHGGFERELARSCPRAGNGDCRSCRSACARRIVYACASSDEGMPDAVFRYMRLGFSVGGSIRSMLSHPDVAPVVDMAHEVASECEKTRQFVRFSHMADGSFFSVFSPKHDTLPLTYGYFRARMGSERFCIIDPVHSVGVFHDRRTEVVHLERSICTSLVNRKDHASDETYIRSMWKLFYEKLALPGRDRSQRGYDLRMRFMPKRLWEGMPEFDSTLDPTLDAYLDGIPERYRGVDAENRKGLEAGMRTAGSLEA
ncbi:MAG: TIGR03915 family putative DNA repair protein [Atopobiaceae bacterium]|nr:TIGR03915 family putative DNA repair protein [Atopobiaceae bacterium]